MTSFVGTRSLGLMSMASDGSTQLTTCEYLSRERKEKEKEEKELKMERSKKGRVKVV